MLFTDGIIKARDRKGELFGYERLEHFTKKNAALGVKEFNNKLAGEIGKFQSGLQADDIFSLTIQTK